MIGKRSLVVLAFGLAVACGDDSETPPEQGQDGSADGDAGSDTGDGSDADGSDADGSETGDGSEGDGASADGSPSDGSGDGSGDGSEGPDLARGEFLFLRSCGTCHGAANPGLAVSTEAGEVNLDTVRLKGDEMIGRINSAERPMPPAFASGDQILTDEEKALVVAYIESVSN